MIPFADCNIRKDNSLSHSLSKIQILKYAYDKTNHS